MPKCTFCYEHAVRSRPTCWAHCPEAPDGKHSIGSHAEVADGGEGQGTLLLDIYCRHCQQSTGFRIDDKDVPWT